MREARKGRKLTDLHNTNLKHSLAGNLHSRMVLSAEAEAITLPSGDSLTHVTGPWWSSSWACNSPVWLSQTRMVPSADPDNNALLSFAKHVERTLFEWPLSSSSKASGTWGLFIHSTHPSGVGMLSGSGWSNVWRMRWACCVTHWCWGYVAACWYVRIGVLLKMWISLRRNPKMSWRSSTICKQKRLEVCVRSLKNKALHKKTICQMSYYNGAIFSTALSQGHDNR